MTYKLGCTGHRKLLQAESKVFQSVLEKLKAVLLVQPDLEVISGMALGFDQTVCRACLDLGVPFIAAVPCEGQDSLWSDSQKQAYEDLLTKASEVVIVNPGLYEPWKMHSRNSWIVKNSQEMIVHWDGFYQGGTGACMKLVKAKKIPWFNTFERNK